MIFSTRWIASILAVFLLSGALTNQCVFGHEDHHPGGASRLVVFVDLELLRVNQDLDDGLDG